jgi:MinD-like ATPase involved in chromosome partitioning or flagellar assembly
MGHLIAVVPATGGVGATTLAAAIAVRGGAAGRTVVAVDLDPLAGRLDVVLGLEQEPGWRWPRLAGARGLVDGELLGHELPAVAGVRLLSGPVCPTPDGAAAGVQRWLGTVRDVVSGLAAAHDIAVLDVPRDDRVVTAVAPLIDALVVVVGSTVPQVAGAAASVPVLRALTAAGDRVREAWVVVRGDRVGDELEQLVADHLEAPVVAVVRDEARVVADLSAGTAPGLRGRGDLVDAADRLLLALVAGSQQEQAA